VKTYFSPAKINLFFRVLSRRSDGFHEVATLMQALSLGDAISFSLAKQDSLTCKEAALPVDSSNLILKASSLFRRKTGIKIYIQAHLDKRIPWEAGLGGGSGNAATTLWAMNEMSGFSVSEEDLALWSAELGSDVPFFLSSGTAYCTGRGEVFRSLSIKMEKRSLHIVKPPEGLSTPLIFRCLDLSSLDKRSPDELLRSFSSERPQFTNDLEIPAFLKLPKLADLKSKLLASGFEHVQMTGSGTAFFCFGGHGEFPSDLSILKFYSTSFLNREKGKWYEV
jgi:4-diphosphocytidyl-2-C-methyl-D-erythritol kinase